MSPRDPRWLAAWILAGLVIGLASARAHKLAPALLDVEARGEVVHALLKVPRLGDRYPDLKVVWPEGCAPAAPARRELTEEALLSRVVLACPKAALVGAVLRFEGLSEGLREVVVSLRLPAEAPAWVSVLTEARPTVWLPGGPGGSATEVSGLPAYVGLGVRHILEGLDHLLFVLGLMLVVARRAATVSPGGGEAARGMGAPARVLLATVTAFTVAHSITLAGAVTGHLDLPADPVEICIALSILLLAVELARPEGGPATWTLRRPWVVAFGFGLLHGFGFAGALREIGLPEDALAGALLLFNVGVELGQLAFVVACLVAWKAIEWLSRPAASFALRASLYVIGSASTWWCLDRMAGLLGLAS